MSETLPKMPEVESGEYLKFHDQLPHKGGQLRVCAQSFNDYVVKEMALVEEKNGKLPLLTAEQERVEGYAAFVRDQAKKLPSGKVLFYRELPPFVWRSASPWLSLKANMCWQRTSLGMYAKGASLGTVVFNGTVNIPVLATVHEVWMSLTPMEIISQRPGLRKARGHVLVGGLGMGWFVRRCLKRKQVDRVTVIEKDAEVIKYFGKPLHAEFGNRLRIVHGDAYKVRRILRYDSVLYDIWPGCGHSVYDYQWQQLIKDHPNVWAW